MADVDAFAAKTHFSELVREAERGKSFTIRRRGRPVARLVPIERRVVDYRSVLAEFREIRARCKSKVSVRRLIDEGRRV